VIVAEIELGKIAVQVSFLTMLVNALHAALEDGEIALDGVRRDDASDIFFEAVIDRFLGDLARGSILDRDRATSTG
jgi:hypothetical protein